MKIHAIKEVFCRSLVDNDMIIHIEKDAHLLEGAQNIMF